MVFLQQVNHIAPSDISFLRLRTEDEKSWKLLYYAAPDSSKTRNFNVRPLIKMEISSGDPMEFLHSLGFRFHFEYVKKGFSFPFEKSTIEVFQYLSFLTTRIFKVQKLPR